MRSVVVVEADEDIIVGIARNARRLGKGIIHDNVSCGTSKTGSGQSVMVSMMEMC